MSTDEKAQRAIEVVEELLKELDRFYGRTSRDFDFDALAERLHRWQLRAIKVLSEYIRPQEGKELEYVAILADHPSDRLDKYRAFIQALLGQLREHPGDVLCASVVKEIEEVSPRPDPRKVFVVHGRNEAARRAMFNFLRAVGLDPIEWSEAVRLTGKGSPFIGEILDTAFAHAQAVVVLITGDDVARLGTRYLAANDPSYERELTPQARPNVLFEAGLAFGRNPQQTILVALGNTRPFSDVAGRHIIHMSDDVATRQALADRLRGAGCSVELAGRTDWHHEGDFKAALQSPDEMVLAEPQIGLEETASEFPPQITIVTSKTYLGRHETQTGPWALFVRMRFYNMSSRATSVQSIELRYNDTLGEPQRSRPSRLFTDHGWLVDFPRQEDNILSDRHIPPMKEIERFAYFLLPLPVETSHQFAIEVTFVPKQSREVTFTLVDHT